MENLILVGMPACGKSITGVVLAKTMRKNFVDTDLLIQEREQRPLQEIIDTDGISYFKQAEEAVLLQLDADNTVISTGGSAIYYPRAIEHLKKKGRIVYLKVSLKTVEQRLNNIKTRGVAMKKGDTIEDLYKRRVPLYEKYADITIEADDLPVEETVEKIMESV
ncbi:shikimate kinase [Anaerovorax odorimutans]|uniref:Shikimate kinase n=1 Tax=Anaerovorax odorimutans TaxID=109327 RepID=A0ABT1RQB7_9FIRM|nr:shikimate kinase [Anaerovorax odorimutans]MCQ4637358.1 shikimate kinase [Anaerovorax odorimutans]